MWQAIEYSVMIISPEKNPDIFVKITNLGFNTNLLNAGNKVQSEIGKNFPDLIFLDLNTPRVEGLAFIERIKKSFKQIPDIILTSKLKNQVELKRAKQLGISSFINNSMDKYEIIKLIDKSLGTNIHGTIQKKLELQIIKNENTLRLKYSGSLTDKSIREAHSTIESLADIGKFENLIQDIEDINPFSIDNEMVFKLLDNKLASKKLKGKILLVVNDFMLSEIEKNKNIFQFNIVRNEIETFVKIGEFDKPGKAYN